MKNILFKLPEIYRNAERIYTGILEDNSCDNEFEITEKIGESRNCIALGDNTSYMKYLLRKGMAGQFKMIYVDPPFFSKTDYFVDIKVETGRKRLKLAKKAAFSDKWEEGFQEYLTMIAVRLMLMRELLDENGTIFMHLDWHSIHYVKIIMDEIFGEKNFINEIIWNYKSGGVSNRHFARKHDNILFYSKNGNYQFNVQKEKSYNREYRPYGFKGVKEYEDERGWYTLVNLKDVWQIDMVGRTSSERTGYATQKPEKLIERIVKAVTVDGDLCGDFFCGSGTLGAVCEKNNRQYIMCDIGAAAVMKAHKRLAALNSSHSLLIERINKSEDFKAEIVVEEIDGEFDAISISITGIDYTDSYKKSLGEENAAAFEAVLENQYPQLIEYWCVDINYDGKIIRPAAYYCREQEDIVLKVIFNKAEVNIVAVKAVDVFGNVFEARGV